MQKCMEDKTLKAIVERMNRIQTFIVCMSVILMAYGLSVLLENAAGIKVRGEIILLVLVGIICFALAKFERYFPMTEILDANFTEEEVTFRRGHRERKIRYQDIREVEKMMIINRYQSEKGYYRVKVKLRSGCYMMYSGEEKGRNLDFSEVEISNIYTEFGRRGVKCC